MGTEPSVPAISHAVLIGVSDYEHPEFPQLLAVRNSLRAMRDVLCDPTLGGWSSDRVTLILNPLSATDLTGKIADVAEATTGVLLVYFAGHGTLSTRGELCLALPNTRQDRPKITGLPWGDLADVLRDSPARARVAILDCCFAGQAIEALTGDEALADVTHVQGVYTLTATTRNRTAHVPPRDQQETAPTSFTGELCALIREGIPGKPSPLTLNNIYPELRARLRAKGLPAPYQRGTDTAGNLPFATNQAARGTEPDSIAPATSWQQSAIVPVSRTGTRPAESPLDATLFEQSWSGGEDPQSSWRDGWLQWPMGGFCVLSFTAAFWWGKYLSGWSPQVKIELIALAMASTYLPLCVARYGRWQLRRRMQPRKLLIDQDGITTTDSSGYQRIPWTSIARVGVRHSDHPIGRIGGWGEHRLLVLHVKLHEPTNGFPALRLRPAGWPLDAQLPAVCTNPERRDKDCWVPVCVLGPLPHPRRLDLKSAISAFAKSAVENDKWWMEKAIAGP